MKTIFKKALLLCTVALGSLTASAQGLENIIVEEYHTITQADVDYLVGAPTPPPVGAKVYRVFVDMAPNYKFLTVTGGATAQGNPLDFSTTTTFWNNENITTPHFQASRFLFNTAGNAFDSYLTIHTTGSANGASVACGTGGGTGSIVQEVGVLRSADPNANLTLCNKFLDFPIGGTDGHIPATTAGAGTIPSSFSGFFTTTDFDALTLTTSSTFQMIDDGYAITPVVTGVDPAGTNRVMIGQFTTDGVFSFNINVAVQSPAGVDEQYTWTNPNTALGQQLSALLTYPQAGTPDCLGVIGGAALPGTACNDGLATTGNDTWSASCVCVGQLIDCLGVAGGTALPGTTCNDGLATTGNDVYGANCVCAGQLIDCLGVAGGTALPGTTCNDGLATTGNDVYGANCVCAGQLIDCLGVAGGTALPGTTCNDGLATTGNDVYGANCVCAGQLIDCLGVAGGTALPGTTCDDGLATTGNDVYGANCVCAGQVIDCLGVAGGTALPGTACNDNNPNSTGDVYGANCVCAGVLPNDCLGVPGGPAQPGTPCDDGVATTGNDVYLANCTCAGQLIDCLGVAGGTALPGTTCDDGLATTGNDVYGANCVCAGQVIDCLGVAGGTALPGTACNDNNPNSTGDVYGANCVCAGVLANDCLGVPGGPAQPGTPCDDGVATTGNDVYLANCTCAGQLIDCLGVAGGTALPGTTCDDGLATTGNDVYGANCVCAGQVIDCLGVAGGTALPGTACNDNNPNSTGDVYGANCVCAGVLANDCLGVPGGPAQPGTPCDDGVATTGNDVYLANCTCAGQLIDCLGVAGGTALPGTTCDDGLATTGNDVYGANCVCAGQVIDCLGVAGGTALPGTACNDNNPNSTGDVYGANCVCAGVLANDCLGVPGGPAQPGTPCDDGLATTGNDVYGANCVCAGLPFDCLGVAGGTAVPGTTCDDGLATTGGDVWNGSCVCVGQVIDCLGVVGGTALPGTSCNDNNGTTINDVYLANCTCQGTPIGGCTEIVSITFDTDASPAQTSWEIIPEGGGAAVCTGVGSYAANTEITETCCLPQGCFALRVLDSAGDGITNGGYVLTEQSSSARIIDNRDNFSTGSESAISGAQGFCLPLGTDRLIATSCDKLNYVTGQYLVATPNAGVSATWVVNGANNVQPSNSGYEFWIFDPNGSYSFRRFRSHNVSDGFSPASANRAAHMKINNWLNTVSTPHIPANVLMNVRVRGRIGGVNGVFGPACRMKVDPALAACPVTKLLSGTNPATNSCNVNRNFGSGSTVYAQPASFIPAVSASLIRYQFRFRSAGFEVIRQSNTYILPLYWTGPTALQCGTTYTVDVRVSKDGGATWCIDTPTPTVPFAPWGEVCTVTINPCSGLAPEVAQSRSVVEGTLTMYPNPNRGDELFISLTEVAAGVQTASVDIYDMTGKRVAARTIAVQDGFVNQSMALNGDLSGGLYMVNITAGDKTYTERLVIQP